MVVQLKKMTAKEFVDKILSGERDFVRVDLKGAKLTQYEGFVGMQEYLRNAGDLEKNPIDISNSDFQYCGAQELFFPFVDGYSVNFNHADLLSATLSGANFQLSSFEGARLKKANLYAGDFTGADLNGANLSEAEIGETNLIGAYLAVVNFQQADLTRAKLWRTLSCSADFSGANLSETDLGMADLTGARFRRANIKGADINGANLSGANLRGIENLEYAVGLEFANFNETRVTQEQEQYIRSRLAGKQLFDVI